MRILSRAFPTRPTGAAASGDHRDQGGVPEELERLAGQRRGADPGETQSDGAPRARIRYFYMPTLIRIEDFPPLKFTPADAARFHAIFSEKALKPRGRAKAAREARPEAARYLTEAQLVSFFHVDRGAIRKYRNDPIDPLPFLKVGRRHLYDPAVVAAWGKCRAERSRKRPGHNRHGSRR